MRQITETWADRIQVGYLQRGEVWTALKLTIAKCVDYPLQALTLYPAECKYIHAPVIKYRLPKAGIPSSVHTSLRHALVEDFGFGILDPYTSQCCSWVQSIVNHIWTSSPTSTLLTVAVEDAQLEMGLTDDLSIKSKCDPLRWLTTPSWIFMLAILVVQPHQDTAPWHKTYPSSKQRYRNYGSLCILHR